MVGSQCLHGSYPINVSANPLSSSALNNALVPRNRCECPTTILLPAAEAQRDPEHRGHEDGAHKRRNSLFCNELQSFCHRVDVRVSNLTFEWSVRQTGKR